MLVLATGRLFLRILGLASFSPVENWVWHLALGWICWGLLAEGMAVEGILNTDLMKGMMVLSAFLVLILGRKEALRRCWPFPGDIPLPKTWKFAALFMVFISFTNLLAPEMSWDAMTYQLILPKFYLLKHGFYPVTGIVPSNYPAFGQMLFPWGLIWGNDSVARFFCFLAHLGTALALVALGTRVESPRVGWLAAIFYWAFPYLNIYSTRGYVDLFSNFYAVIGLCLLIVLVQALGKPSEESSAGERRIYGILGALALGAVWGFKYNAVTFWVAGAFLLFWTGWRRTSLSAGFTLLLSPVFFLGPWALKSWVYTHNPVYPYLSGFFQTFDWNDFDQKASAVKFQVEGLAGLLKLPKVIWGFFFQNYSGAPNEEVSLIPLLLLPLAVFVWGRIDWKKPVIFAATVPFFFWLLTSHQLRLISSSMAFMALLLAGIYERARDHWRGMVRTGDLILGLYFFVLAFYFFQGLTQQPNPFANFLGFQSRTQFLEGILRPEGCLSVVDELNQRLPSDAKVLIVGQQNGYYLDRVSTYDFDYTYPVLKKMVEKAGSPEGIYSQLRRLGFTHLLYNSNASLGTAIRADGLGVDRYPWSEKELGNYEKFFLHYTRKIPLPVSNGYSLYAIGPREGFSTPPDFYPGTEILYLKNIRMILGLPRVADIVGKPLSQETYVGSYLKVSDQHPLLGYPCFQWAFAELASHPESAPTVLEKGRQGFSRSGDKASWLALQGDVWLAKKQPSKAIPLLLEAQNLSPEREDVARNLTVAYYNVQDLKDASLQADRAATLAPFSEEYQRLSKQLKAAVSSAAR